MNDCVCFSVEDVVSVFMGKTDGDRIAALTDSGLMINMSISVGQIIVYDIKPSRGPAPWLYISIGGIVLLVVGLSVLLLCGLCKSRYSSPKHNNKVVSIVIIIYHDIQLSNF